jgi:DNA polymerase-3 subunit gamma/tau
VLVKAAAPELDPSMAALQARIERLEQGAGGGAGLRATHTTEPVTDPDPEPRGDREPATPTREPDPQPAQVSEAEPAGGAALELDAAAACWPAVIDLVRGENAMLAALLADARPVALKEQELTLAFPGGAAFLKRKAEQEDHRRVAGEALKAVTGQRLALRYELRDDEEEPEGEPVLSGEELVQRFMEEFDAEEVLEDDPDEGEVNG